MFSRLSEKTFHRIRWVLTIGWFLLIASLIYDPITVQWTQPQANSSGLPSPFRLDPNIYLNPQNCVKIRSNCISEQPFALGTLIWWSMIVPSAIFILLVFGHEFWRRICPLSFMSQLPRALGIQRKRTVIDPVTGHPRQEVATIEQNSWLGRNHLYVQFGLFVLGLAARLLWVNGDRILLAGFLIATIACAIFVGYLYNGKSWCHYFCPMSPVQLVYTGPRALLGSQAHRLHPGTLTQSMCRTANPQTQQEQGACVACKTACFDIDAENAYWQELKKPGRRLVQYGYLGMVIAFYLYFFLYSGNWDYYFTGSWAHEEDARSKIADVGFYIFGSAISIPKWIAIFLTFAALIAAFVVLGCWLEKQYRSYRVRRGQKVSAEQAQHVVFTAFTIVSFWAFFSWGARPTLNRLPPMLLLGINALIVLVGTLWAVRTFGRSQSQYKREKVCLNLRQQLEHVEIPNEILAGRSLDELSVDEIYTLAKTLPNWPQESRLRAYADILADVITHHKINVADSFSFLDSLRQTMQLSDSDHFIAIQFLAEKRSGLFTAHTQSFAQAGNQNSIPTVSFSRQTAKTISYRPKPR